MRFGEKSPAADLPWAGQSMLARYRFFREHAGYQVGRAATTAWELAKAEKAAEDARIVAIVEPELESYRDVYGEDPPEGVEFVCVAAETDDGTHLGGLGFVEQDPKRIRVELAAIYAEGFEGVLAPGKAGMRCAS
jgi:hypothetical protein